MIGKIRNSFNKQLFMKTIGAYLGKASKGYCEIILPFSKKITQQHGLIHGGVIATIADNSAAYASFSLMKKNFQPLTIEFKINFLHQSICNSLIAKGEVIREGKTIFHAKSEIFSNIKKEKTRVAYAIATIKSSKSISEKV